jgi:hypothetical protein
MAQTLQTLRTPNSNAMPAAGTRKPGELFVKLPDRQIGVIDNSKNPMPLVGVRFFSAQTNYAIGDHVIQGGIRYRAIAPVIPGAFNPAQWQIAGGSVSVGDSPPSNPQPSNLWFDSVGAQLYIWFNDGTSSQWVLAVNQGLPSNIVIDAPSDSTIYGRVNKAWAPVLPTIGGTLYGPLTLNADPVQPLQAATKAHADTKLPLAGGTMTGLVTLAADPVAPLGAVTKQYPDTKIARSGDAMMGLLTLWKAGVSARGVTAFDTPSGFASPAPVHFTSDPNSIVTVNVHTIIAPTPNTYQQTGALVSYGATTLNTQEVEVRPTCWHSP